MNILGVIPARGGKQQLPNKNILPLLGRPVIAYTILAAQRSSLIDRLVVSTENEDISSVARQFNVEVVDRPSALALDTSPLEDSLRHAVEYLEKKDNYQADIVVHMLANVPVRKEGIIDKVIDKLIDTDADSVVTVYPVDQYPQWMKKIDQGGYLRPFLPPEKEYRRQDIEQLYLLDGAVMAIKKDILMETAGMKGVYLYTGRNVLGVIQDRKYATEIDTQEDFSIAESFLKIMKTKEKSQPEENKNRNRLVNEGEARLVVEEGNERETLKPPLKRRHR